MQNCVYTLSATVLAVLDTAVNCIEERIKQPGLQLYVNIKLLRYWKLLTNK